jgi:iron complex outermembrane receptor protein
MQRIATARLLLLAGVSTATLCAVTTAVRAQSVNYGALENLYGEPVTTSVTGKPQKASEAPANLTIITQDDIRRSGANNIPDVLQFVTGVDIRRYGANDSMIAVQGYNQPVNPRLLVMVNGRQVYFDHFGYTAFSTIPVQLEEIRQIEVVMGPNTSLFGFNAASGVINIITFDPLFDSVNSATARFGNLSLLQGSAVTTAHIGDSAGVRLSAGGLQMNEFTGGPTEAPRRPRTEDGAINIDSKARVAPGVEVMLEASISNSQASAIGPQAELDFNTYHTNSIKAGLMADTRWGALNLDAYRNWMGFTLQLGLPFDIFLQNTIYVVQASDTLKVSADHTIRVGVEYRDNMVSGGLVGTTVGYSVYSASGMWDWQINPTVDFSNSVRIDYLSLNHAGALIPGTFTNAQYDSTTITQPSFNSGLVFKLTDDDTMRLTAGRGLQVPSLMDFGLVTATAPGAPSQIGNPTLQPTAVWNLEAGYDHNLASISSLIRTSVFVQRNDNLLTEGPDVLPTRLPTGRFAQIAQNSGYSTAVGGQIGIKGQSESGFRWNASYMFEFIHDEFSSLNKVAITSPGNYQDGTPTSVVIVGGGYTRGKLEIDAQARWQSRYTDLIRQTIQSPTLTPIYVSDYVNVMARVGYNLTDNLTLALTGQQFYISRLVQTAGPPVQRTVIASVTAHF